MIWGDFSNLNRFIVSEENQLSDIVGKFSSLEVEQLFVVDDKGKLLGLISPHDLFDKPMNSKVSSLMRPCPFITEGSDLYEVIGLVLGEIEMKAIPVCRNSQIVGILSPYDILQEILKKGLLEGKTVSDVVQRWEILTFKDGEAIDAVKVSLREINKDFAVVIDHENRPVGLVTEKLILGRIARPIESLKGKKWGKGEIVPEHVKPEKGPVSEIMVSLLPGIRSSTDLNKVIRKMIDEKILRLIVKDNSELEGVVTYENLLRFVFNQRPREELMIQISGAEDIEEEYMDKYLSYNAIRSYIQRIANLVDKIIEVKIDLKTSHKKGEKRRYIINMKVQTSSGFYHSRVEGWEFANLIKEGLEKLERQVRKDTQKR